MSYILDALKRAESERSRGQIPGLHAQPMARVALDLEDRSPVWQTLMLVVIAVVVLGALAWWWLSGDGPAPAPAAVPPLAASPSTGAAPASLPALVNAPAPVVAAVEPVASAAPKTAPRRNPPPAIKSAATPANNAAPGVSPAPGSSVSTPVPRSQMPADQAGSTRLPGTSAPVASGSAPEPRVLAMSELPADVISSLPALVVSGASYSDQPASRMVIINGALYHEGDRLTSELTLQRIALRSAVLSFRGYRFGLSY